MADRKSKASGPRRSKEEKRIQAIYAKSREDFTARDLQKFTELEKGIPFAKVLAKLERMHQGGRRKRA